MLKLGPCPFGRGNRKLTPEDRTPKNKRWIAHANIIGGMTQAKLAARFGLSVHTVKDWVKEVRRGGTLETRGGRPPSIAPEHHQKLAEFVNGGTHNVLKTAWREELHKAALETGADAGKASCYIKPLSRRSIGRMESLLDVHMGNAEVTTTARALAIEDVRNSLSFCVMNRRSVF
jgi:transposase